MKASGLTLWITLAFSACSSLAVASDWSGYYNNRFQYQIDIPPNFSKIKEADNGDGGVATSQDGGAELRVWGSYSIDRSFVDEAKWRIDEDRKVGWSVTYEKRQPAWAAWSGLKGNRIFYERTIPVCNDAAPDFPSAAAYFRLEYDQGQKEAFDPIIARLTKSLQSGKCK